MYRIAYLALLALLTASCSLFGTDQDAGVHVQLQPERVEAGEKLTLTVSNATERPVRYHCGYKVEVSDSGAWKQHTSAGCIGTEMPVTIAPEEQHTLPVEVFAEEAETYRLEVFLTTRKGGKWTGVRSNTNSVTVKQ